MPRILLVEDDAAVRLLWEEVLLGADCEVDTAETAEAGGELIGCCDYDLIVTDGRFRDGIGIMLADVAREKGTPALIVTGYKFIFDELRADQSRYTVLLKPILPSELLEAVTKVLGRNSWH
jgi:DNA-binding response OmpR family regulator